MLLRASPAIAETAEDVLAEEETAWAEEIGPPEPAAPPERVWWLETADGRRLRL